ncbi:MAG: response regulator transcription factor [Cyanobacteria bacterium J06554_11]
MHTFRQLQPTARPAQLKHIVIIAGETELAETLQMDLNAEGYQVSVVHDGMRGLLAVKRITTDLVVVGWSPPRLSGLEVCDRLRSSRIEEPIILLTEGNSAEKRIAGLEAGASDCISLPFVKEEFFARVQACLNHRRANSHKNAVLRCAGLQLNRKTREVFRGDRFIRLTAKEFDLLEYMMNHYFQVLTRSQILENVWGYEYSGSSNIIEVYIRYLRKKLELEHEKRLIHTIRSVGYILRDDL